MGNNFDFVANIPALFFAFCFLVLFILFLWGGIILLRAKGFPEKIQKGRKILMAALIALFVILLIMLVFYLVSFLLQKWETSRIQPLGEFPLSPAVDFPSSPQFIKIGKYYFTGPWLLKEKKVIENPAVYTILCRKNIEYDIIYIGEKLMEKLLNHNQYGCWLENCDRKLENLYVAILWTPKNKYGTESAIEIQRSLESQTNPPCQ